jgi:hypothetical protein
MVHDVFVSYSSKDKPTADAVCAVLESHGVRCWVAPRDILPGQDWGGSIIKAINGARAMVLVFSTNANTSNQIKREVERAVNKGIPVIPLRIEDVLPSETLEFFISTPHWLDAFAPPLERHLEYLAEVVQKIIGGPEPSPLGDGSGVKIAIIDSGIEVAHPSLNGLELLDDLALTLNEAVIYETAPGNGIDVFGHGTAMAGIIRDAAPAVKLGSFRVLDENLATKYVIVGEMVRSAIERAYDILFCGFGSSDSDVAYRRFKAWNNEAFLNEIHVVTGCNNFDCTIEEYPSAFPTVISVNMAKTDLKECFYRPKFSVPFWAQGVDVEVCWKNGTKVRRTGSTFAAARVAGILACLLSKTGRMTPTEARLLLQKNCLPWSPEISSSNDPTVSRSDADAERDDGAAQNLFVRPK